jgi:hypothetical protein
MSFSVSLPLDDDGFLRRECPSCEREFKWHDGPTEDRPEGEVDPPVYWCPLCGESAGPDSWWAQAQLQYIQDSAMPHVHEAIGRELTKAFRGQRGISFKSTAGDLPVPDALHEPNDMVIVHPPCHPWEPVKIPEQHGGQLHCLICGSPYAV